MNQTEKGGEGRRGEGIVLLALVVLSILLRSVFARQQTVVAPDGATYGLLARKFLDQGFYESLHVYWSPLYPILTAMFATFIEDLEQAGRMASVFCGAALVVPVYLLAKKFHDQSVATLAAGLVVFYPSLIESSISMLSEALYTLLFACMVLFGWSALTTRTAVHYAVLGISLGLLYLTRTEAYGYLLLFVLLGGIVTFKPSPSRKLATTIRNCTLLLGGFLVIASPYLLFLHDQTGGWSFGLRGINVCYASGVKVPMNEIDARAADTPKNIIVGEGRPKASGLRLAGDTFACLKIWNVAEMKRFVRGVAEQAYKIYRTYQPGLLPALVVALVSVGLFAAPWDGDRSRKELYLSLLLVATLLGYAMVQVTERYLFAVIPIFIIWAAVGIVRLAEWGQHTIVRSLGYRWGRWPFVAVVVLALLMSFAPRYYDAYEVASTRMEAVMHKEAGLWSGRNLGEGLVIMSWKPYVAFYGKGRHLYVPDGDYSRVIEYASRKGVDVFVVETEGTLSRGRQLEFLLDEIGAPKPLVPVYKDTRAGNKIILYRMESGPMFLGDREAGRHAGADGGVGGLRRRGRLQVEPFGGE